MKARAFRVEVKDWPQATSIIRTQSAARAKFLAWNSANDVGYKVSFGQLKVRRAPEYDYIDSLYPGRCYGIDYVETASL